MDHKTMENNTFTYQYSAPRNREVERIRSKYLPCEVSRLETLRLLDRRVQMAGTIPGLTIGVFGCLIFGIGLCFGLDVLTGADLLAPLLGGGGIGIMLTAYPVYRALSKRTREKLTPEILRLSDEIMKS